MKKQYSFIAINEKTKHNFSISLSKLKFNILLIVFIFCLCLSIYGSIKLYYQTPYIQTDYQLYNQKNNFMNMIDYLKQHNHLNDSLLTEYSILEEYINAKTFLPIIKPVDGYITQGILHSKHEKHDGIDIAAVYKSDIYAIQNGLVVFADFVHDLGNTVILAHQNNHYSLYAHLYKSIVTERQLVNQGDIIGYVGKKENDDAPHLQFEIWHNNVIIDPRNLIKEYEIKDVSIK